THEPYTLSLHDALPIFNEQLARSSFGDPQLALGKHLKVGGPYMDGPTLQIVGVVANTSQESLDAENAPMFYYACSQNPHPFLVVVMRTSGDPAPWMNAARRHVS